MTPRQLECLKFLRAYIGEHGFAPTYEEITAALGLAGKSSVHRMIVELERFGHVRRHPFRNRAIEIVNPDEAPPLVVRTASKCVYNWRKGALTVHDLLDLEAALRSERRA